MDEYAMRSDLCHNATCDATRRGAVQLIIACSPASQRAQFYLTLDLASYLILFRFYVYNQTDPKCAAGAPSPVERRQNAPLSM